MRQSRARRRGIATGNYGKSWTRIRIGKTSSSRSITSHVGDMDPSLRWGDGNRTLRYPLPMLTTTHAKGLADLPPVVNDSLLALIALCDADPRPEKIDVGVGVFRDAVGNTPILKVMKEAEQRLVDTQPTKAYLGSAGDKRFTELLRPILLGEHAGDDRILGLQTPGGCGALRLGFELLARANPGARALVGA